MLESRVTIKLSEFFRKYADFTKDKCFGENITVFYSHIVENGYDVNINIKIDFEINKIKEDKNI
jgi:hypothetical protein